MMTASAALQAHATDSVLSDYYTREELADYLRTMCEIREFEDGLYNLYRAGQLRGATHMSAGQEAVPTGAVAAITRRDLIASTHRGHGHCGAMGNLMAEGEEERRHHWNAMMAELFGKATGYCRGRGGSMHIADVERGNLGATGIVALAARCTDRAAAAAWAGVVG